MYQQSPESNANKDFDALIDLLASDGIPSHDAAFDPLNSPLQTVHLRDESGKLNLDKIRLMFAKQNLGVDAIDDMAQMHSLSAQHQTNSQDALSIIGLSRSVSPSSQSSEPQQGSRIPSSNPPASLGKKFQTQALDPVASNRASHSCSSPESSCNISSEGNETSCRNPPSSQTPVVHPVPHDHMAFLHQASSTGKSATRPTGSLLPLPADERKVQGLTKPLQFQQMNDALSRTTSEVDTLREQYETLRALVAEWLPPSKTSHGASAQLSSNHFPLSSQAQASVTEQGGFCSHSDDILRLSESEAKKILTRLVTSLRLSSHSIKNLLSENPDSGSDLAFPSPRDVEDVKSSMEFLASVDELVWKRSTFINGGGSDPLYSRSNIDALVQRLALWEKTVRGGPH